MSKKPSLMNLTKPTVLDSFIKTGSVETVDAPAEPAPQEAAAPAVAAAIETPAPETVKEPAAAAPRAARTPRKAKPESGEGEKKTSFTIHKDLHKGLKILAIRQDRELQELVNEALEAYLRKHSS